MLRPVLNSPTAAGIGSWIGILTFLGGALSWLSKNLPRVFGEMTWPEAIFVGILSAAALSFLGSIIFLIFSIGYRRFRPYPVETADTAQSVAAPVEAQHSHLDETILQMTYKASVLQVTVNSLGAHVAALQEAAKTPALNDEQMDAVNAAVAKRRVDVLEELSEQVRITREAHETNFTPRAGAFDGEAKSISAVIQRLVAHGVDRREIDDKFAVIDADIKAGAEYMIQNDEERERFTTALGGSATDMKRQWHSRGKKIEYLQKIISAKLKKAQPLASATSMKVRPDGIR